jgi:hypothetical protein
MSLPEKNSGPPARAAVAREGVTIRQCEHIRISGQRCGSPALRDHKYCYFHDYSFNPANRYKGGIPMIEDATSIQVGLLRVIRNLEEEPSSSKNYGLMLYALQTASANLKRVREEAAVLAETVAAAQKAKAPSLFELLKKELESELDPPPDDCVE